MFSHVVDGKSNWSDLEGDVFQEPSGGEGGF